MRQLRVPVLIMSACAGWLIVVGAVLIRRTSVTIDEPGHFAAGISYWRNGNYALMTGNFFFTQKWAAWPVAGSSRDFPNLAAQARRGWNPSGVGLDYLVGTHRDPREIIAPARWMILLLCVATAALIAGWAAWIAGPWAGTLALVLFVTSPVVLANGVLVTTDTGATLWFVTALVAYATLLDRPRFIASFATGGALALLLLSKFTFPAWLLAAAGLLLWSSVRRPRTRREWLTLLAWHVGAIAFCWGLVWLFFGFQFRPGGLIYLAEPPGNLLQRLIAWLARHRVLPEPMLSELFSVPGMVEPRSGYLFGDFRTGGHWLFFPVVFVAKSTVALLLALGAWLVPRRAAAPANSRCSVAGLPCVVAGITAYAIVALASPVNIGVRHILPLFALTAVAGGVALARRSTSRAKRMAVAGVVVLATLEAASAYPRPQGWFNALVGGPMHGYRIAIDSTLGWGDDVADLVTWQRSLPAATRSEPVFVNALGPPVYLPYGLEAEALGYAFQHSAVRPGFFVFDGTRLLGGSYPFFGQGTAELDRRWRREGAGRWRQPLTVELSGLACSRLAAYCRERPPVRRLGPVYFVYHLDAAALAEALDQGSQRSE